MKDKKGKTKRKVQLKCKIDDPNARVKWFKNGQEILPSDPRYGKVIFQLFLLSLFEGF